MSVIDPPPNAPVPPSEALRQRLDDLGQAMSEHRRQLSGKAAPAIPVVSPAITPADVGPGGTARAIARLADAVRLRAGIKLTDSVRDKLARVLSMLPADMATLWIEALIAGSDQNPEWQGLIETLTIHETYFFRDQAQMRLVRERALPEAIRAADARGDRSLRLWSAATATGEEAYTLAMLALEALAQHGAALESAHGGFRLLGDWNLSVLGTDLSRPVLTRARNGVYDDSGLSPFRELPASYGRFFVEVPTGDGGRTRRVRDDVRAVVRFDHHNLMAPLAGPTGFDLVLLRNVLTYFDDPTREHVQRTIAGATRAGGWLALGSADQMVVTELFDAVWGDLSVLYRRTLARA